MYNDYFPIVLGHVGSEGYLKTFALEILPEVGCTITVFDGLDLENKPEDK